MRKTLKFIIILLFLFTLVGCSKTSSIFNKTMTCKKEVVDKDGLKSNQTMKVTYNSKKVLKVHATNLSEVKPDNIDLQISFIEGYAEKFNNIEGLGFTIKKVGDNKVKLTMDIDYTKLDAERVKKDLGELINDDDGVYKAKNKTIEQFKKEQLDGYKCK